MWPYRVVSCEQLFIVTIAAILCVRDVSPVPSASTNPQWRGSYSQSSYWYSDYAVPKPPPPPPPKKSYLPTAQHCPDTGRTVCAQVKPFYPTDDVFEVIRAAKAKRFNISSEFVDESLNDEEPQFSPPPPPAQPQPYGPPPKHEGYVVYQTALHYDNNHYNKPNNHHYRQPYNNYQQDYGYNSNNNYNNNYNFNQNRNNFQEMYAQKHRPVIEPNHKPYSPYGSHYSPTPESGGQYSTDKYNDNNYYPQQSNGYQQPYDNEMVSQTHQTRYKRQTSSAAEVVDPVCPSRMILVEPKAALNDKSQWKFVINLADRDPRLKQAIKVEVCQTPGQPCSNQISLPFGFVSRCKQKYIKKKLLSLDSSGQSISSENFFSPSCCVCEVVRNTDANKRRKK